MSKHTPGPWLLEDRTVYALNSDSSPVNRFWSQVERGWADQRERTSFEEAEANARLIAAAPDLLEALSLASQSAGFQYMTHETRNAIDEAIAKATGEQS